MVLLKDIAVGHDRRRDKKRALDYYAQALAKGDGSGALKFRIEERMRKLQEE